MPTRPIPLCGLIAACCVATFSALSLTAAGPEPVKIEVEVDTSEVPDLAPWGEDAKKLMVEWYPRMANLLPTEGFETPTKIRLYFKKTDEGVAATYRDRIQVSSHWVEKHPEDVGMIIHEMVHVIQHYPRRTGPGWVTEGVADYLRYVVFEGRPMAFFPVTDRPKAYTAGYNMTAGFFFWLETERAPGIVNTLNTHMRKGTYADEVFEKEAGKPLDDLWQDYVKYRREKREAAKKD